MKYTAKKMTVSVIGVVGVPAKYGGFETLVENLVRYHHSNQMNEEIIVYCSRKYYPDLNKRFMSAELRYIPLSANGMQSIPYDIWSLFSAVFRRTDIILMLGVSGALVLPLIRILSTARIVTNIDGIEWRRNKWHGLAKLFLRFSEMIAVRYSHVVISDNDAIMKYVQKRYSASSRVIAYGGDHALAIEAASIDEYSLPENYAFSVCRIEPENNIEMIVNAFSEMEECSLVIVGNWGNSEYGKSIRARYKDCKNIYLIDPIYDLGQLKTLRSNASYYVHGHSAGGTNPSLVEAMHFGKPILAYDCDFNRSTTENAAAYFSSDNDIVKLLHTLTDEKSCAIGMSMLEIAQRRYTWDIVADEYFALFDKYTA